MSYTGFYLTCTPSAHYTRRHAIQSFTSCQFQDMFWLQGPSSKQLNQYHDRSMALCRTIWEGIALDHSGPTWRETLFALQIPRRIPWRKIMNILGYSKETPSLIVKSIDVGLLYYGIRMTAGRGKFCLHFQFRLLNRDSQLKFWVCNIHRY